MDIDFTEPIKHTPTESIWDGYWIGLFISFFFFVSFDMWAWLFVGAFNSIFRANAMKLEIMSLKAELAALREEKRKGLWRGQEPEDIEAEPITGLQLEYEKHYERTPLSIEEDEVIYY